MALILNIDTSMEEGSVCITVDGQLLAMRVSRAQKDHASWIQPAINELMEETGYQLRDLAAVAVAEGPGSYTGLRVAMATAKGLCYPLGLPLITENTLRVMAYAAREKVAVANGEQTVKDVLFCPMIDARRMEVFTALYDAQLQIVRHPSAMILNETSYNEPLNNFILFFTGNGVGKWKHLCTHRNARYTDHDALSPFLGKIAAGLFLQQKFADIAYANPVYLKEFYSHNKK